jgi:hypothetical protein
MVGARCWPAAATPLPSLVAPHRPCPAPFQDAETGSVTPRPSPPHGPARARDPPPGAGGEL